MPVECACPTAECTEPELPLRRGQISLSATVLIGPGGLDNTQEFIGSPHIRLDLSNGQANGAATPGLYP